jgi:hypothetical protein
MVCTISGNSRYVTCVEDKKDRPDVIKNWVARFAKASFPRLSCCFAARLIATNWVSYVSNAKADQCQSRNAKFPSLTAVASTIP